MKFHLGNFSLYAAVPLYSAVTYTSWTTAVSSVPSKLDLYLGFTELYAKVGVGLIDGCEFIVKELKFVTTMGVTVIEALLNVYGFVIAEVAYVTDEVVSHESVHVRNTEIIR